MSFAAIMVHVDPYGECDDRIRLAAALAGRFGATLIGACACMLPPYPAEGAYFVTPDFIAEERRAIAAALGRAQARFHDLAGAAAEWRSGLDLPDDFLATQARAADLVIIGRAPPPEGVGRTIDPGAVLLKAGRPLLVVPPGRPVLTAERIVIGWKDGREARRAVHDALPLLRDAAAVVIVAVCDRGLEPAGQNAVDDVAHHLRRHGVSVTAATAAPAAGNAADELIRVATAQGADLIVTGAYGHSRLGEWMFGGVTRGLLAANPVCGLVAN